MAEDVPALIAAADAKVQAGDIEGALDLYDQAIARSPWSGDAWRQKAMALASDLRFEESLEALEAGARAAPDDDRMIGLLITNLREVGRKDEAFDRGQRAIETLPRSIWIIRAVADTWRDKGEFYKAQRLYDRGLDIAPDHSMLLNGKATALFLEKDYAGAVAVYRRLVAAAPGDSNAWLNIAYCEENQGHKSEAIAAYDEALALKPANPVMLEGRADASPTLAEAQPFIDRLAAIDPARAEAAGARAKARG